MNNLPQLTALVLAGGRGTRFGGADKGLQKVAGQPLAQIVAEKLSRQCATVMISCNRNQSDYAALGYPLCMDQRPGFQGPLAGLESALSLCKSDRLVVCPCDTPGLPADFVRRMAAKMTVADVDIVYAKAAGHDHYLCALIKQALLADLSDYLDSGGRKVSAWFKRHRLAAVDFESEISNLNDAEALKNFTG